MRSIPKAYRGFAIKASLSPALGAAFCNPFYAPIGPRAARRLTHRVLFTQRIKVAQQMTALTVENPTGVLRSLPYNQASWTGFSRLSLAAKAALIVSECRVR
jgi:hypothetical protein